MIIYIYVGHDRPALKLLNKHVRKKVSSKWYDLGLELLEPEDEANLIEIESNNPSDAGRCCKEMFHLWLRKCTNATWNQLIYALKEIELNNLATTIEEMLIPTENIVNSSAGMYISILLLIVYIRMINNCIMYIIYIYM